MPDVRMIYSESLGTWNVFNGAEWYYEGNYEQCCKVMDSFYFGDDDDYYEEEYDYE